MVSFQENIDFLGIHVVNGHIQMQPHVLTKLADFPNKLKDTKTIQRFLGVLNYIHKYIPRLSEKIAPIRKHLQSGWSNQANEAIKKLKAKCQNLPKLQPPGEGLLILQIDASDDFWVVVLFERGEDKKEE